MFYPRQSPRFPSISAVGLPLGTMVKPGGEVVAYLRSTGAQDRDPRDIQEKLVTTLGAALARCRAGMGDTIVVLPGHQETFSDGTALTGLVAGTRILGPGAGQPSATFTLDDPTSSLVVDVDDVFIQGLKFAVSADVTKAIQVTGNGFVFIENLVEIDSDMSDLISLEGCDDARILGNVIHDLDGSREVTAINVPDGTTCLNVAVVGNVMSAESEADGTGLVDINEVCANLYIADNDLNNKRAAGTNCISFSTDEAHTGIVARNMLGVTNDGTAASQGIVLAGTTSTAVKFFENYCCDEKGKSGVLAPAAVAT